MSAAGDIRTAVERGGGRYEISVRDLRDSFGFPRLTAARRDQIIDALAEQGLEVEPPLVQGSLDDRVEIVEIAVIHLPPPPSPLAVASREAAAASLESIPPRPRKKGSRARWARNRGVLAGTAVGLLVVLTAAVYGAGHGDGPSPEPQVAAVTTTTGTSIAAGTTTAPPSTTTAPAGTTTTPVDDPTAARAQATTRLGEAKAAIADRDPAAAQRLLAQIDDDAVAEEPDLLADIAATREEADLLGRYLDAKALGDAGSYAEAQQAMLALVPFRKSAALAENYGRLAAR